ncbi:phosphoacetylglucosamine mutase-like [Dendronephthya gigantea]|uniref:phosphoacetylglucosamine mutase-like n=1 Tax=Dendronephthya gigantea TaxID=151771 RepID=UPI00106A5E41|nr:phosphoacetylglucosamine mutase-like [Dendronephthya gigantea]
MESLTQKLFENVSEKSSKYPKPEFKFTYGTAGFRLKAELLPSVMYRMGLLAVLRSRALGSKTIGLMITASHNPVQDNGVKLIDPMGEMLEADWEKYATQLANSDDVVKCLKEITQHLMLTSSEWNDVGNIVVARDTRPSGNDLSQAVVDGADAFGGKFNDLGILTTPQLHFIVRCINDPKYGSASEDGYYHKISSAFLKLTKSSSLSPVNIDGANGVGAPKMSELGKHLKNALQVCVFNDGSSGELNKNCGADFVKIAQKGPEGLDIKAGCRYVSFDGDADRIVYFYYDSSGRFHLLDGDKISTLFASYLKEKLEASSLNLDRGLGVVQTAYANGSSTSYLRDILKIPVACVKTGVKHLHKKAQDFDVGVYFEANGHGTVLFSEAFKSELSRAKQEPHLSTEKREALEDLESAMNIINETVGDALSDMLMVEAILCEWKWDLPSWDKCYGDLPNRQRKVRVKDRTVITTTDAERKTVSPEGLQSEIDALVAKVGKGRSFARPSGTEDVVRVYAEGETQESADSLALAVSGKVYDLAGGVGDRPT